MFVIIYVNCVIKIGDVDLVIVGGVEYMIRGLWVIFKVLVFFGCDVQMYDSSFGWCFVNKKMKVLYGIDGMGVIVENLVEFYDIS